VASLVRDLRAGRLTVFAAPGTPGRNSAPTKDAARGRAVQLRRAGLSVYEISARLGQEGTPLGRSAVSDILREEGFGRLLRGPAPEASTSPATSGRDTRLPPAAVVDFAALPARAHTTMAGLLLAIPDLVALDLPALAAAAGYPGTRVIPAISWLLSLLALKLTATRRVSPADDLLTDPAPALLAGLSILPKKTALTDYSYRLSHDHQLRFLAALDKQMIATGLATAQEAIFDLDFHAVMHRGQDPTLEKHYVPTRSQRARSVLTFFAQHTGTHNLGYANADLTKATQNREVIAFCDRWKQPSGAGPKMLIMDQKATTQAILGELDARGVKFATLRMRSPSLVRHINSLTASNNRPWPCAGPAPSSAASRTPPARSSATPPESPSRSTAAPTHPSSATPASPQTPPSPGATDASSASSSPDPRGRSTGAEIRVRHRRCPVTRISARHDASVSGDSYLGPAAGACSDLRGPSWMARSRGPVRH
jgi:hypothetical protein